MAIIIGLSLRSFKFSMVHVGSSAWYFARYSFHHSFLYCLLKQVLLIIVSCRLCSIKILSFISMDMGQKLKFMKSSLQEKMEKDY